MFSTSIKRSNGNIFHAVAEDGGAQPGRLYARCNSQIRLRAEDVTSGTDEYKCRRCLALLKGDERRERGDAS